jgi:hypothetical protein
MRGALARKVLRRTAYGLVGLVGLVVVLLVSTYAILHTDWGREQVRGQLQKTLAGLFVGKVSLGRVEGDVLGDVILRDLAIDDADGRPAVRARTLRVTFGLLPLIGQTVEVSRLRVEGLRVDGATRADGTVNLAGLLKKQEKRQKSTWSVNLRKVVVVAGALALTRPAPDESVHLDGFEVRARVHLDRDGSMDGDADLAGRWRERDLPLTFSSSVAAPKDRPIHVPLLYAALGGVQLAGRELTIDLRDPTKRRVDAELTLVAPDETVRKLAPTAKLHQDVVARLSVHPGAGAEIHAVLSGALGKSPVDAELTLDPQAMRVHGLLQTHRLDLRAFAPEALATLVNATFAVDAHQDEHGDLVVKRAHIYADAHAGDAATRADAHVDLVASGTVSKVANATALAVRGNVTARDLVHGATRAKIVQLDVDAAGLPARPHGHVHLEAAGVYDQGRAVGMLVADARSQPDRSIVLKVRSVPPSGPWLVDIDAVAKVEPDHVQVALGRHVLRTKGLNWWGQGGTFEVRPDRCVVAGLRTHLARGAVAVDATYYRAGARRGDLEAAVAADHLDLAEVDRSFELSPRLGPDAKLAGIIDARAQVRAQHGRYTASIGGRAQGLSVRQNVTPIDASLEAHVAPDRFAIATSVRGAGVGAFSATLDVQPPARLDDALAWQKLDRTAIRQGRVTLENLDLAAVERLAGKPPTTTGRIDGELTLTSTDTSGILHVRNVQTPSLLTPVDAELIVHRTGHGLLTATLNVNLREVTTAHAVAELEIPARPFDVAEWMRFDADEVRGITFKVDELVLDGRRSRLLGLKDTWHGRVSFLGQVDPGLGAVTANLDVTGLRGGPLARPADLHVEARLDGEQLRLNGSGTIDGRPVIGLDGHAPIGLSTLLHGGGVDTLLTTPVVGRLSIDQLPLSVLASTDATETGAAEPDAANAGRPRTASIETVNGRAPLSGTMNARVMVMGTFGAPTGRASVVVANVGGGDGHAVMRELRAEASYDGTLAHAQLHGEQSDGGKLMATVDVPVARASELAATLSARHFDLAPLEHLAPVRLYGLAGIVDADLKIKGAVVARDTSVDGHLKVAGARLPLAAAVGTLRRATLDVSARNGAIKVSAEGDVGDGHMELTATAQVDGLDPKNATATLHVDQITLVNQLQPKIAGAVDVKLSKDGDVWRIDAKVHEASLTVPPDKGRELHDPGAPSDMVFIENGHPVPARAEPKSQKLVLGQRPLHPYLVAKVTLTPTRVQSKEFRGTVRGEMTATLGDDGMAIDGLLTVARGEVDLFDRRYRIERANLRFDGNADPVLDIRLIHDFPELTLYASVRGRLSKPVLDLTSEPGTYSQGQLLSFLLGGTPGADPGSEVQSAATGVASSLLSQKAGKYLGRFLPVDFDVLRFEAATAGTSAAVTIGKWLTPKLFVAYRRRLEARPDENSGEGELEYYLGKRVLIEATVGDRGYHGADLLWLRRW